MRQIYVLAPDSYGHMATLQFINAMEWRMGDCQLTFCGSHEKLLDRLAAGPGYAVVPIQTSIGPVTKVVDQLLALQRAGHRFDVLSIMAMQINHCLMSLRRVKSVSELQYVCSKPEALAQCDGYLTSIGFPPDRRVDADSTSEMAQKLKDKADAPFGVVASEMAARTNHLKILARRIQDRKRNRTTFQLLRNRALLESVIVGIVGNSTEQGELFQDAFKSMGCIVFGSGKSTSFSDIDIVRMAKVVIFAGEEECRLQDINAVAKYSRPDQLFLQMSSPEHHAITALYKSKADVAVLQPIEIAEYGHTEVAFNSSLIRINGESWRTWLLYLARLRTIV